ncbi:MAG: TIGR04283 family arsenosugar biosynthesis glycosyltransferase [Phormidium sp. BM_Day4_Bin.17]|nr:TIGR04283 family arsenosugar biosynthesis glycosyltransferase [Phormidium sp. BM_Day4_Bin.17]UCJ12588.1 MAG: TIGR04283 family arsenosugar biosynthesis glycosyltransferase [Phormidium sp. PBR-2020]
MIDSQIQGVAPVGAIVFTRYPEPGKTKTRLIPALGARGAAWLQEKMTRHTVDQLRAWREKSGGWLQIRYVGGSARRLQAWLGEDLPVRVQGPGDLGDRLVRAFQEGFAEGVERLVVVGIDCPELDEETIAQALESLEEVDLVLGPATDGGYYLIGLRAMPVERFEPLCQGIDWGSDRVLGQTLARSQELRLTAKQLSPLSDVDVPEELGVWDRARYQSQPLISVIIPVLNEAAEIAETLERVLTGRNLEVIVVDGGSQDNTVEMVQGYVRQEESSTPVRLLSSPSGRALQFNVGLQAAQGDFVLLLHGDTRVPRGFDLVIRDLLRDEGVVAGAFELAVASQAWPLRWVEWGVRWRSRGLGFPYGDQGLFLSRQQLLQLGGIPDLPLMEDFELVRRLQGQGRIAIAPVAVVTSARRWDGLGVLRVTLLNQLIVLGYLLGISPKQLAQWYRRRQG